MKIPNIEPHDFEEYRAIRMCWKCGLSEYAAIHQSNTDWTPKPEMTNDKIMTVEEIDHIAEASERHLKLCLTARLAITEQDRADRLKAENLRLHEEIIGAIKDEISALDYIDEGEWNEHTGALLLQENQWTVIRNTRDALKTLLSKSNGR